MTMCWRASQEALELLLTWQKMAGQASEQSRSHFAGCEKKGLFTVNQSPSGKHTHGT